MGGATDLVSPCIGVCELDALSGLCRGCLRSAEEIAAWSSLCYEDKRALLDRLHARRRAMGMPVRRTTRRRRAADASAGAPPAPPGRER